MQKPKLIDIQKLAKDRGFVLEHIDLAIKTCFYGEMLIKFEAGRVVVLQKQESFKP